MKLLHITFCLLVLSLLACQKEKKVIDPGNDPNFSIERVDNAFLGKFEKQLSVFEISIYAVYEVENEKLLHAANIMAQYLDNDEDGAVDNPLVHQAMKDHQAFMVMWKDEDDLDDIEPPDGRIGQDLGNDETMPAWHINGQIGRFDAALEEVFHIITHAGYAKAYPDIFGEQAGTSLTKAMDIARGGHFQEIPDPYPSAAWYSYDDETCEYECMAAEYIYWAMTSILGAQANRQQEIGHEWRLHTPELVAQKDTSIFRLLTDKQYAFPTILPDGTYRR